MIFVNPPFLDPHNDRMPTLFVWSSLPPAYFILFILWTPSTHTIVLVTPPFFLAHTMHTYPAFLWDPNLRHPRTNISNGGYTVSIGENATWVSVGANTVLSHGSHYWEVVLEKYGSPSMSRKAVIGVVDASFHQWHRYTHTHLKTQNETTLYSYLLSSCGTTLPTAHTACTYIYNNI